MKTRKEKQTWEVLFSHGITTPKLGLRISQVRREGEKWQNAYICCSEEGAIRRNEQVPEELFEYLQADDQGYVSYFKERIRGDEDKGRQGVSSDWHVSGLDKITVTLDVEVEFDPFEGQDPESVREEIESLHDELDAVILALDAAREDNTPSFDAVWEDLTGWMPDRKFGMDWEYDPECYSGGDVEAYPYLDDEDWLQSGSYYSWGVEDGKRFIHAHLLTLYGRFDAEWDDEGNRVYEDSPEWEWKWFWKAHFVSDDYFKGWAEYYLWVAENLSDPLDAFSTRFWDDYPVALDGVLNAVKGTIESLKTSLVRDREQQEVEEQEQATNVSQEASSGQ